MMLGRFSLPSTLPFEVNETPTTKLQNLCRMCATSCNNAVSLFGPEGVASELAIKFCSYLPVKVSEMDTLPLQLCYDCTSLLIQWDAAVLVAIAADKKLRALQWREQFDKQRAEDNSKLSNESNTQRLSNSASEESLSCSVCPKSGMVFRELIEHLKSHKMPQPLSNDNSRANCNQRQSEYSSQTIVPEIGDIERDQSVNPNILEPLICLETLEPKRNPHPKKNQVRAINFQVILLVNECQ